MFGFVKLFVVWANRFPVGGFTMVVRCFRMFSFDFVVYL